MAAAVVKVVGNLFDGKAMLDGIDKDMTAGAQRINIPYSAYTKEEK